MKKYIPYIILVIVISFCTNFVLDEIKAPLKETDDTQEYIQKRESCFNSVHNLVHRELKEERVMPTYIKSTGQCYAVKWTEIKEPESHTTFGGVEPKWNPNN